MSTIKKIFFFISLNQYRNAFVLLALIIVTALIDMIGVASILPFITVLTNPDLINNNQTLKLIFKASNMFGVENNQEFLFFLGLVVFILLIFSLIIKSITTYFQARFIQMCEYNISKKLIESYLYQPYIWFLDNNSSDLGKNILSEVQQLINNGLNPLMELIAKSIVLIALIFLLILTDPILTLIIGLTLLGSYGLIFLIIHKFLDKIGRLRLINNELRFLNVNESFGSAKEIKASGIEKYFINKFSISAKTYALTQSTFQVLSQLPRFILEAIAFGGVLLIILYYLRSYPDFISILPMLSLFIYAGYRLMPALQQIYISFTQLTFIGPSIDKLYKDLKGIKINEHLDYYEQIYLKNKISLKNIYFNYPNSSKLALKNVSLDIKINSTVGIIGTTGSGKTTLIDILLGLLEAQKGSFKIDGIDITKKNLRSWQMLIGYVPQQIYLADTSLMNNIAYGIETKFINKELVEKSAKIANLHDFIFNSLPKQYLTTIGERGVKLSGGQKQRIGIARALYGNPRILILDEATSALDNDTEDAVMDAIHNLSKKITIIIITHRRNTLKNCDKIFEFRDGSLISEGTFDELIKKKPYLNKNKNRD